VNASSVYGHVNRCLSEPHTHTHTHPFNGPLSGTTPGSAGTGKVKPIWILLKQQTVSGSGISWAICKSAPCSRQITTPAPHHSVFLQAGCHSCRPTNSVKALKSFCLSEPLMRISGRTGGVFIATEFNISAPTYFPRIAYKPRHRRHKPQHVWAASENQCFSMNSSW